MRPTDPRERFDDLHVVRRVHEVDRERFDGLASTEAFGAGWVSVAVTLDADDRVLLAYDADDEAWLLPGGAVQPGETLDEALVRELREETGVPVTPERPHSIREEVVVCDDAETAMRVVFFEATPETTEVGADLGVADESITRAEWFDELPAATFEREFAAEVLNLVRES